MTDVNEKLGNISFESELNFQRDRDSKLQRTGRVVKDSNYIPMHSVETKAQL